ncbi:MAG: AAA family ATPase [Opitutaceae bacterium]
MPSHLQIHLLGDFSLSLDGEPLTSVDTPRLRMLLTYLALRPGVPQVRSKIAFLFWPDSTEKQALTNLRHLLHELKANLPGANAIIETSGKSLRWSQDASATVDVTDFRSALVEAGIAARSRDTAAEIAALERALSLYSGDLLPGTEADWISEERESLRETFAQGAERLVRLFDERRDYSKAIRQARRLLRHEPTRESWHALLIKLHMANGDRAAGLQAYRECVGILERELSVGPSQAIRELHERLLVGEETRDRRRPPLRAGGPELAMQGRDREWSELKTTWERASQGSAHLTVLVGEAGIGKTRLAEELLTWVGNSGGRASRTRSYAAEGRLPYAPATQWLRSPALQSGLRNLEPVWKMEIARLLPELRQELKDLAELEAPRESWHQQHLLEALSRAFLASTEPLLLVLDDLQWTDQETLDWLRYLLRHAREARLLIVGTIRVEELPPDHPVQRLLLDLERDGQLTQLGIGPLSKDETASIAAQLAGRALTPQEVARLWTATEGNPLYVVESIRAGLRERGPSILPQTAASVDWKIGTLAVPPKVHAVITMRLAQLSADAREITGVAAVIGREFPIEVLIQVCGQSEEELFPVLDELWQKRIMFEHEAGVYDFTHDKIREVAYADMISPRRRMLHRRAADALETIHFADLGPVSAQLGAHFEAAGLPGQAIEAYHRAADAARQVYANEEAIRLFGRALSALKALPATSDRSEMEIVLNSKLVACLVETYGYPAPAVWGIYDRAVELCEELGRPTDLPILRVLAIASLTIGDLTRARRLGEEFLRVFDQTKAKMTMVEGEYILGVTHHWLGNFARARQHLETSLANYDPADRARHITLFAQDPKAVCLVRLGWSLWFLGYPDQAADAINQAVQVARSLHHPHTEGYALCFGAQALTDMGRKESALALLDSLEVILADHPMAFWDHRGRVLRHFLSLGDRPAAECVTGMREAMAAYDKDRCFVCFSHFLCYIARAYLSTADIGSGLATIQEAYELLETIDERHYLAEIHRIRGELLAAGKGQSEEIEAAFGQALEVARIQGARSLELRAALSLGRFRLSKNKRNKAKAHALVREVADGFTEGFDFPDLIEARAFLDECS